MKAKAPAPVAVFAAAGDLETLRLFFAERKDGREIVYDPQARGYRLTRCASRTLTSSEVLAVCKILLDSRSMVKDEMFPILDKST